MKRLIVDENGEGERIDKYLIEEIGLSRNKIQERIKDNNIKVNNQNIKSSYSLKNDDIITIERVEETDFSIKPEDIPLDIQYEDDDLIVVNKPSGMVTHPAFGHTSNTLVNALLYHCKELSDVNGAMRPGIVHRLDKDTSGLMVIAKNNETHIKLAQDLKDRKITRGYMALVSGLILNDSGTIDAPIGRNPNDRKKMMVTNINAKEAVTHFKVIERLNDVTLVECRLETGRTHQIRVHFGYIDHPIINDSVYGYRKTIDDTGQMLHAYLLAFNHPKTREYMEFRIELPTHFIKLMGTFK
ncbi:MAG: RluA family pseudouridine synthase [Bacilli bacterium]|nr:RluA family pseudouridine synthase [Bacilli bacterium]